MNNTRYIVSGYVESIADRIEEVIDYLYKNAGGLDDGEKSADLITGILRDEGFEISKYPAGVNNYFVASYGSSRPRIAYICEYNVDMDTNQSQGYNVSSAINMGAGIGLKRIVDEIGGSVLVAVCKSGEGDNTKIIMQDRGVFNDVDAVICAYAADRTCESGSSLGMTVLNLRFKAKEALCSSNLCDEVDALKPCIMVFNLLENIKSKYSGSIYINGIICNGGTSVTDRVSTSECSFMVKSQNTAITDNACREILDSADFASKLCRCSLEYDYPRNRYLPLKTHEKLSKIACHNLKESGIIEIHGPVTASKGLAIGNLSHKVPVIYPYIGICETATPCSSKEFSAAAISSLARENAIKAAKALALTGVDIIQRPDLLDM